MSVADMTGKRWVEKTHIHMAERRFGIPYGGLQLVENSKQYPAVEKRLCTVCEMVASKLLD
jgi:hypothetical protein